VHTKRIIATYIITFVLTGTMLPLAVKSSSDLLVEETHT